MAEIFFITRGHHDHVDKFVRNMRSQWGPMNFKKKVTDESGKQQEIDVVQNIDFQLRPYQLWGYVVPEQFVQPVCNNLGIPTNETVFNTEPGGGGNSFRSGFGVKGYLTALRLAMGAKKLPAIDPAKGVWHNPIYKDHINILGIGWKPDEPIKSTLGEHEGI